MPYKYYEKNKTKKTKGGAEMKMFGRVMSRTNLEWYKEGRKDMLIEVLIKIRQDELVNMLELSAWFEKEVQK